MRPILNAVSLALELDDSLDARDVLLILFDLVLNVGRFLVLGNLPHQSLQLFYLVFESGCLLL